MSMLTGRRAELDATSFSASLLPVERRNRARWVSHSAATTTDAMSANGGGNHRFSYRPLATRRFKTAA